MSWDVSLVKEAHEEIEAANYTWNVSPMYKESMGLTITDLNGKLAADVAIILTNGIIEMTDNPKKYRDMNPLNGWGNYEGAIQFLAKIVRECLIYPEFEMKVQ